MGSEDLWLDSLYDVSWQSWMFQVTPGQVSLWVSCSIDFCLLIKNPMLSATSITVKVSWVACCLLKAAANCLSMSFWCWELITWLLAQSLFLWRCEEQVRIRMAYAYIARSCLLLKMLGYYWNAGVLECVNTLPAYWWPSSNLSPVEV